MIYCVWYPSGGFGHYINAILSLYGKGFVRPKNLPKFSSNGNSHELKLVAPKYRKDQPTYNFKFDPALNYSVLIDNGINNESTRFQKFFPGAKIFKLCYSDFSWPVIAKTMIVKAMHSNMNTELAVNSDKWSSTEPWARREKYFLFLRDHSLRYAWKPDSVSSSIMIEDLIDYNKLCQIIGIELDNFQNFWNDWLQSNVQYFQPILTAQKILQGQFEPVEDVWTQAVVYYQIWCKYGVEVPHNDYSNWFESYEQIVKMLKDNGVNVDSYS